MIEPCDFRLKRIALNHGGGSMPAIGFGTLIADAAITTSATKDALEAGYRHFDCAERYRNEREVGEALQAGLAAGGIAREEIFVTTKLWNSNHRPERVKPAFDASLERLRLDYLDLYLIHTPFAFQAGDEQDPRDANGNVLYDEGVTLLDTWRAMEDLVDGEDVARSVCPTSASMIWYRSMNRQESSRPWFRSRRILIFQKTNSWSSARKERSCFWRLRR